LAQVAAPAPLRVVALRVVALRVVALLVALVARVALVATPAPQV
jgi:hypothetical protein